VSSQISSYLGGLDSDGGRELEIVNGRRAELGSLIRKFGPTLDDTIGYLESGSARLLELDNDSDRIESLGAEVGDDRDRVVELASRLSDVRRDAAIRLSESVTAELGALAMPNARLVVDVTDREDYGPSGKDTVSILLAPHQGAEPRPLGKGASGGELSRVMLAIEVVIAGSDPVPTFIFDEVDAGVGGASAIEIGRRLARLSRTAQVIVVTHLAQVAAFSTNHLRVVKDSDGAVTASSVQQLQGDERIAEMARLLSGLPDSESGLAHARELLDTARALDT
jgi:DNA repair protein RecN (Recombination protein N)